MKHTLFLFLIACNPTISEKIVSDFPEDIVYWNDAHTSVYIEGEGCTINATLNMSVEEFQQASLFCAFVHGMLNGEISLPVGK